MTPEDYINSVVGKPWRNRAEGPEAFDCFGLVIDSFRKVDGVELPQIAGYVDENCDVHRAAAGPLKDGTFRRAQPQDGAIMVAYDGSKVVHVGRVMAGRVIHAKDGNGVMCHSFRSINRMFSRLEYYLPCL